MNEEQAKQPPLSERVFDYWFVLLPWLAFVVAVFVFAGLPLAGMLVVCWVKGSDAYFHQGIRFPLGHGLYFSDGSAVPQLPNFLITFAVFIVVVPGLSAMLLRIVRFYEQRRSKRENHEAQRTD